MEIFPSEFSDLLSPSAASRARWSGADGPGHFSMASGVLSARRSRACFALLDNALGPLAKNADRPLDPNSIWGMRRNYTESLTKVMRQKSVSFESTRHPAYKVATKIGLLRLMRSESLARLAETVSGERLERANGVQAILYGHGDYVGPHNDHHPEQAHLRHGYVDVHLSFVNEHVDSQSLVCQGADGHLNALYNVTRTGSIAVYRLPFWHYVTPLMGRPGHESKARRWVLMASYTIAKK